MHTTTGNILPGLLARAIKLFEAGSELVDGDEDNVRVTPATIFATALHVVQERYGDGDGIHELQGELMKRNPSLGMDTVQVIAKANFYQFISGSARAQATALALAQATTWLIQELESDPAIKEESTRRQTPQEGPQRPTTRRRRRRTTQG